MPLWHVMRPVARTVPPFVHTCVRARLFTRVNRVNAICHCVTPCTPRCLSRVASRSTRFAHAHTYSAGGDEAVQGSALSTSGTIGGDLNSYTCPQTLEEVGAQPDLYNKISMSGTARMANGDTVVVSSGNYEAGSTAYSHTIFYLYGLYGYIMCTDDELSCVLDGSGTRQVMTVKGTSGSVLELRSLVFSNGFGEYGGGFRIYSSAQVSLVMCSIQQNEGTTMGGGIDVYNPDTVVDLYGVSFSGNMSPKGPDISSLSGTVTIHSTCSAGEN